MTNLKSSFIGVVLLLVFLAGFSHVQTKLRRLDAARPNQKADLERLSLETRRLSDLIARITNGSPANANEIEILRLRGEVARLRTQTQSKGDEAQGAASKSSGLVSNVEVKYVGPACAEELVRTNISVKVGDQFSLRNVDEDVARLYASGYFSNAHIEETAGSEGHTITYVVQPTPRLKQVIVRGNTHFDDNTIIGLLSSKLGGPLDEERLFFDARKIRSLYEGSGFSSVEVKADYVIDEQSGEATITIEIAENI